MNPDLLEANPVADALCAARDDISQLSGTIMGDDSVLLSRDEVLAILRRHIDQHVFGEWTP